jgi:galactonate dehydratase
MRITAIRALMARDGGRPRVLVKVETDEGIVGWGEAYNHGPDLALKPLLDYIFEMIKGEDPRRIEYIMLKLFQQFRFPPGALGLAAMSGVDHALWDISGKAAGLPVYMLLGGTCRDKIRVYRGIVGQDGQEAADQAHQLNEQYGFTAFKVGPFVLPPDEHRWGLICNAAARFFEDIRKHTPEEWEFAFDPHAKIFEPVRALQLSNALAPYDPLFYEEPLRPEHTPAWSRLRAQMQVPLATGECLYTRFEFLDLLASNGADIIQPDICACGGLLEMRKIAAIAEAHYVTVVPHNPMGPLATAVNLHFAAATPNFKILEYRLPDGTDYVKDPYLPKDGYLELRDTPGWGVEINEDATGDDQYVHWERTCPGRPDGSSGYI